MFDYSPIKKNMLPQKVFEKILDEFKQDFDIEEWHWTAIEDSFGLKLYYFVELGAIPSLFLYTQWRSYFYRHGYEAPILEFTHKES